MILIGWIKLISLSYSSWMAKPSIIRSWVSWEVTSISYRICSFPHLFTMNNYGLICCQWSRKCHQDVQWMMNPVYPLCQWQTTFLSLDPPCLLLVLQSHSAVSILSSWHCSIMHLPVHSLLSANVLSGSYISRNNGEGEWTGSCYCTRNRKNAWNGLFVFKHSWQVK